MSKGPQRMYGGRAARTPFKRERNWALYLVESGANVLLAEVSEEQEAIVALRNELDVRREDVVGCCTCVCEFSACCGASN